MNAQQHRRAQSPTARRTIAVAGAALTLVVLTAVPSSARQDAGPAVSAQHVHAAPCLLERIGTQFVRCDDLTGNGVAAPAHIHAR